ncbi:hypothetical protein ABTE60_21260, partial [Acinetobacter baumannii]
TRPWYCAESRNTVSCPPPGDARPSPPGARPRTQGAPVSAAARQLLRLQIRDEGLRRAVTPDFTLGCKRILFANNYYPALQADNTT